MTEVSLPVMAVLVFVAVTLGTFLGQVFYGWYEERIFRARIARLDQRYGMSTEERVKMESVLRH